MKERDLYARQLRLAAHGYATYRDYIVSPAWNRTRARFFGSPDTPKGCICGATGSLILHHKTYVRVCDERLGDLIPLCPPCHSLVHELEHRDVVALDEGERLKDVDLSARYAAVAARSLAKRRVVRQRDRERRAEIHWVLRLSEMEREARIKRIDIRTELRAIRHFTNHRNTFKLRHQRAIDAFLGKIQAKLDEREADAAAAYIAPLPS